MVRLHMTIMGALLILLSALFYTPPAQAQNACALRQAVTDKLEQSYHEQASAFGLTNNGMIIEVFTSPEGSWTIFVTRPDGVSCLLATGENWQAMNKEIAELES